jgi:hypothetical protein
LRKIEGKRVEAWGVGRVEGKGRKVLYLVRMGRSGDSVVCGESLR